MLTRGLDAAGADTPEDWAWRFRKAVAANTSRVMEKCRFTCTQHDWMKAMAINVTPKFKLNCK